MVIGFDTLKAAQQLQDAGFAKAQAEALVTTMAEGLGEGVATKADIAMLRSDLAVLRSDLESLEQRLTAAHQSLEQRLTSAHQSLEQRLVTRLVVAVMAATGLVLAAIGVATTIIVQAT